MKKMTRRMRLLAMLALTVASMACTFPLEWVGFNADAVTPAPTAEAQPPEEVLGANVAFTNGDGETLMEWPIYERATLLQNGTPWLFGSDSVSMTVTGGNVYCDGDFKVYVDDETYEFAERFTVTPGNHSIRVEHPSNQGKFSCQEAP